jgi:hypothetical protein
MSDTLTEEQLFAQQLQIRTTGIQHICSTNTNKNNWNPTGYEPFPRCF